MSSQKSRVNKLAEERELARKNLPAVQYHMALLRWAINSPANMNANGLRGAPKKPTGYVLDEKTGHLHAKFDEAKGSDDGTLTVDKKAD
ncbi:hypothetical protein FSARC_4367 [Fusarium sarcochroum]|uniref:Uncharacterized protein n=1 Tax=Fusarium sarcochroum TaxID=1208366 RepID=A0A8H4XAR3_9HYPO|nr:hypothetical protein FSARC_4367 [Fusarium sarcochroum]